MRASGAPGPDTATRSGWPPSSPTDSPPSTPCCATTRDFWARCGEHFSDELLADLALSCALWIGMGRVLRTLDIGQTCKLTLPSRHVATELQPGPRPAQMTTTPLAAAAIAQLEAEGVDAVIGTVVNPAGLTLAKTVPIRRTNAFADPGLGASPAWHGFAIDQTGIAFTAHVGVVGDQRVRIDLSALRIVGDGLAWAPGSHSSSRTAHRFPRAAAERWAGSKPRSPKPASRRSIGHEIEFLLGQPRWWPTAVDVVGAVRPGRRARARSVRSRCHRGRRRRPASRSSSSTPSTAPTSSRSPWHRNLRWPRPTSWC